MLFWQEAELARLRNAREAEIVYQREQNELEVTKMRELGDIETGKFKNMVDAIGAETLQAIATAGPDMQVCAIWSFVNHENISWFAINELSVLSFLQHFDTIFNAVVYQSLTTYLLLCLFLNPDRILPTERDNSVHPGHHCHFYHLWPFSLFSRLKT